MSPIRLPVARLDGLQLRSQPLTLGWREISKPFRPGKTIRYIRRRWYDEAPCSFQS